LAALLLIFRLVEGQFAIFWVAGTMTLPWLIVGMSTGAVPSIRATSGERNAAAAPQPIAHPVRG
jgi:hypothetical protein